VPSIFFFQTNLGEQQLIHPICGYNSRAGRPEHAHVLALKKCAKGAYMACQAQQRLTFALIFSKLFFSNYFFKLILFYMVFSLNAFFIYI
jgi:hypothetical protein